MSSLRYLKKQLLAFYGSSPNFLNSLAGKIVLRLLKLINSNENAEDASKIQSYVGN